MFRELKVALIINITFKNHKTIVKSTSMPALDYGGNLYCNAASKEQLNTVYPCALRFIANGKSFTHHMKKFVGLP